LQLILSAAVTAAWIRSVYVDDTFVWQRSEGPSQSFQHLQIRIASGHVRIGYSDWQLAPPAGPVPLGAWRFTRRTTSVAGDPTRRGRVPFLRFFTRSDSSTVSLPAPYGRVRWRSRDADISVPLWGLAAVLALPPALWWGPRWLRRRIRRRKGLCLHCGYGTPRPARRSPEALLTTGPSPGLSTTPSPGPHPERA